MRRLKHATEVVPVRYSGHNKMFQQPRKKYPSAERVRALLDYNPETGVFTWRRRSDCVSEWWNGRFAGTKAGSPDSKGYIAIAIDNTKLRAHRLAWIYIYGYDHSNEIDHRDTNRTNNRIDNLRPATTEEQRYNMSLHKDSLTGLKGVSFVQGRRDRYRARIYTGGKEKRLGEFDCPAVASITYQIAADVHFGHFSNGVGA